MSLFVLESRLKYNITNYSVDESHTLILGFQSIHNKGVYTLRVGESTRWLARVIYPAALYYMNSNMGGTLKLDGWDYPGGSYLKNNFTDTEKIKNDPNIQDFVFAMRFILGSIVILSFVFASYFISKSFGFFSGIIYLSLTFSATLVNEMLSIFYTESTLVIIFNLIVIISLIPKLSLWRLYIWSSFLLSFAISTKLTGVIFSIPIFVMVFLKDKDLLKGFKVEVFFILIVFFLASINIFASSYKDLIDQSLSNVFHFKNGHNYAEESGIHQLVLIFEKLEFWVYLFILSLISMFFIKFKNKLLEWSIILSCILFIVSGMGVSFFLPRNLTTPLVMMIFTISIVVGTFFTSLFSKKKYRFISISFVFLLHSFFCYKNYKRIEPSMVLKHVDNCNKVGLIDFKTDNIDNYKLIKGIPKSYNLISDLEYYKNQTDSCDCILVNRINNNRQFTNYILPINYKLDVRYGNYFGFKSKY